MKKHRKLKLKREVGLFGATLTGVGIILGAGIYVLIGKAAGLAGNAVWMSFLFAALLAALTGLSYAELSSMFPKAGAEYEYTRAAFNKRLAFIIGWLIVLGGFISSATVALGFSGYFHGLFGTPIILTGMILIIIMSFILFYGIKDSVWLGVLFTFIETGGLIFIIILGFPHIGSVNYFEFPSLNGIFHAAALVFFAFIGFEEITKLSEETKKPEKNIPKALLLAIVITTIIYVLVAISSVSVLNWAVLGESTSPLADVASKSLGPYAFLMLSVTALFSTFNTVLLVMLATSRIIYGMAKSYNSRLSLIHSKRRTPWVAIGLTCLLSILFLFLGKIEFLANMTNFMIFLTFFIVNLSVIKLRYSKPDVDRKFKTPINIGKFPVIPLLGVFSCVFLLFNIGLNVILYSVAVVVVGLFFYEFIVKRQSTHIKHS